MKPKAVILILMVLLSGCLGITSTETPTQATDTTTNTPTITPDPDPSTTPTTTASKSPAETTTDPQNWDKSRKYTFFGNRYNRTIRPEEVTIRSISTNPDNESMVVEYRMDDPENKTRLQLEQQYLLVNFAITASEFEDNPRFHEDKWIPKHLEITGYAPSSGDRYYTAYTNYSMAKKYSENNISSTEYVLAFWDTSDFGSAADV